MNDSTALVPATADELPTLSTPETPEPAPLQVAGVAGGVGARTVARLLQAQQRFLTYPGQQVDVLVTSITASATAWLPIALRQVASPPVLAVSHTVPGPVPPAAQSRLRTLAPQVSHIVHVPHIWGWLTLDEPPGDVLPRRAARARRRLLAAVAATPSGAT
jgi:hypothetical protein